MILLIEPHPDDVCLSAFRFCKEFQKDISLFTVFTNEIRDSKEFCRIIELNYIEGPHTEETLLNNKINRNLISKSPNAYKMQCDYYTEMFPEKYEEVVNIISKFVNSLNPDRIVTCLGVYHPFHVIVNMAVRKLYPDCEMFVDLPYVLTKYCEKIYKDSHFKVQKIYQYDETLAQEKIKTFLKCYPTERNIIKWNRDSLAKYEEVLLSNENCSCDG